MYYRQNVASLSGSIAAVLCLGIAVTAGCRSATDGTGGTGGTGGAVAATTHSATKSASTSDATTGGFQTNSSTSGSGSTTTASTTTASTTNGSTSSASTTSSTASTTSSTASTTSSTASTTSSTSSTAASSTASTGSAMGTPEDTVATCSDHVDNDLDGLTDCLDPDCVAVSPCVTVWINELHYNNASTDANEEVEIAGVAGTSLTGYSVIFYNGGDGTTYTPSITLTGTIPNQSNGYGTLAFPRAGIQNGPDGLALISPLGVVQFLSYGGSFAATNGAAMGMTSVNIGVSEPDTTLATQSLQLTGAGHTYSDFTWAAPATATAGAINNGQTFP